MRFAQFMFIAVIASVPSASWATPKINVSPDKDHPKGKIGVKGAGFDANEMINVRWDEGKILFTVSSDADGNFVKRITKVPKGAFPGTHAIEAKGADGDSAQVPFTVATPWTQFGFTSAGTRENPYENVISIKNVGKLSLAWSATIESYVNSSPIISNGVIYIGASNGYLYALDALTGATLWTARELDIESSPAVSDGVVLVGDARDGGLHAYNAKTGAAVWTVQVGWQSVSSPVIADGTAYVSSVNVAGADSLSAFRVKTGESLWSSPAGTYCSSPAVADGVAYVGCYDGKIYAFETAQGTKLWTASTGGSLATPAVSDGVVYVGSSDQNLYAFDATTGALRWSASTGDIIGSTPSVANGRIYYLSSNSELHAFNAATGALDWVAPIQQYSYNVPAVANGVVYISPDGGMYAFNASSGKALWTIEGSGYGGNSSPSISDGKVYTALSIFGGVNVSAYALDARSK